MSVSYKKLWKLLIDKDMIKKDLREKAGLTTNVIAKLGKDQNVSTEVLCKICKVLDCGLEDIIEIIPDEEEHTNGK
ncbi:MAG: helix-turn-helix transcriptional regulator [Lachnospiraceae bacterium]|nr:helix-turn-helix transcriptional regulator [Lachnospiraceae bacterium]